MTYFVDYLNSPNFFRFYLLCHIIPLFKIANRIYWSLVVPFFLCDYCHFCGIKNKFVLFVYL
jgi:hypothetical protein